MVFISYSFLSGYITGVISTSIFATVATYLVLKCSTVIKLYRYAYDSSSSSDEDTSDTASLCSCSSSEFEVQVHPIDSKEYLDIARACPPEHVFQVRPGGKYATNDDLEENNRAHNNFVQKRTALTRDVITKVLDHFSFIVGMDTYAAKKALHSEGFDLTPTVRPPFGSFLGGNIITVTVDENGTVRRLLGLGGDGRVMEFEDMKNEKVGITTRSEETVDYDAIFNSALNHNNDSKTHQTAREKLNAIRNRLNK